MAMVVAYEDAKAKQKRHEPGSREGRKGGGSSTNFFGSRSNPDMPLASLNQHDQGYFHCTHFHTVDQFQVIVDGEGTLGRHELKPYGVHFTHAHTPYGPLVSDHPKGLSFIVMRAHPDTGSQKLPKELEQLKAAPNRNPRQITQQVTFPPLPAHASNANVALDAVAGMQDEYGLAVHTLRMKPNSRVLAPDPARGEGQYLVIVKGSVRHESKEHKALTLVFVWPHEGPYEVHAGAEGLEAVILNFPNTQARLLAASKANTVSAPAKLKQWRCALCAFEYDETKGMPDEGIAPGTRWGDVPATWSCPDCGAVKADFQMAEV